MNYTWATATHVGYIRDGNEDAVVPADDGAGVGPVVVAIADGMGGHVGGEVASRLAIDAAAGPAATAAIDTRGRVEAGNDAVIAASNDDPNLLGMGTTLTLALFDEEGIAHIGHVGDSRLYLLRNASLRQVTVDHTWVMDMQRRGQLSEDQAANHPRRHLLTRVLGMENVDVDIDDIGLRGGDRILLCSDGLTNMLSDDSVEQILVDAEDALRRSLGASRSRELCWRPRQYDRSGGRRRYMTRSAEAALLGAAVVIAAMGVALVNFSTGEWLDAQVALTLLVFGGSYGSIHVAIRRWAPTASPLSVPSCCLSDRHWICGDLQT